MICKLWVVMGCSVLTVLNLMWIAGMTCGKLFTQLSIIIIFGVAFAPSNHLIRLICVITLIIASIEYLAQYVPEKGYDFEYQKNHCYESNVLIFAGIRHFNKTRCGIFSLSHLCVRCECALLYYGMLMKKKFAFDRWILMSSGHLHMVELECIRVHASAYIYNWTKWICHIHILV